MNEFEIALLRVYFATVYNAPFSKDCDEYLHIGWDPNIVSLKEDGFIMVDGYYEEILTDKGLEYLRLLALKFQSSIDGMIDHFISHIKEPEITNFTLARDAYKEAKVMTKSIEKESTC